MSDDKWKAEYKIKEGETVEVSPRSENYISLITRLDIDEVLVFHTEEGRHYVLHKDYSNSTFYTDEIFAKVPVESFTLEEVYELHSYYLTHHVEAFNFDDWLKHSDADDRDDILERGKHKVEEVLL